jgi:hypothetical protein
VNPLLRRTAANLTAAGELVAAVLPNYREPKRRPLTK